MSNRVKMFNAWQLYKAGADIYEHGAKKGTKRLKLINYRKDVFNFEVIEIDNDCLVVSENSGVISFAFIGSDDLRDWIDNLKFKKEDDGDLHRGFESSAAKFESIITTKLKEWRDKYGYEAGEGKVYFIGHSRGGALALIAADAFCTKYKMTDVNCVTYGQPRVGDHLFDLKLEGHNNLEYLRVVFSRDPVCELPLNEMGYEHPWFGDVEILPETWWHRFRVRAIRVHLDYNRTINKMYNKINTYWNRTEPSRDRG